MGSTNIFNGIVQERSSSRVLKPPGGGQTDVLGLKAAPEENKGKKINPRNFSSIMEGTDRVLEKPQVVEKTSTEKPQVVEEKTEKPQVVEKTTEKPQVMKENTDVANGSVHRPRVPPGGFSSGSFW